MDLREDALGDVTILEVKGHIDSTTACVLGEKLSASLINAPVTPRPRSAAARAHQQRRIPRLLLAARRAEEADARFVLCSVTGKIHQLFEHGGFLHLFSISGSREDAITALR